MRQDPEAPKGTSLNQRLRPITPWVIVLCAITLGMESYFHRHAEMAVWFRMVDFLFLGYFTVEIGVRLWAAPGIHVVRNACHIVVFTKDRNEKARNTFEEACWLAFDSLIVLMGLLSLFRHYVEHPELIMAFRLFRVFRVLRLFEVSPALKNVEKKILSVIPTVLVFAVLQALILYVYAIIGMNIYGFRDFGTLHFSTLYEAVTTLFIVMTNGWSGALYELKEGSPEVSPMVTDLYLFSFFTFSVMITLNVFVSVMASQVQSRMEDKLEDDLKDIEKQEEQTEKLLKEIREELRMLKEEIRQKDKSGIG